MADKDKIYPSRGGVRQRGMVGRSPRSRASARPQHLTPRAPADDGQLNASDYNAPGQDDRRFDPEQIGNFLPNDVFGDNNDAFMEQTDLYDRQNHMDNSVQDADNYKDNVVARRDNDNAAGDSDRRGGIERGQENFNGRRDVSGDRRVGAGGQQDSPGNRRESFAERRESFAERRDAFNNRPGGFNDNQVIEPADTGENSISNGNRISYDMASYNNTSKRNGGTQRGVSQAQGEARERPRQNSRPGRAGNGAANGAGNGTANGAAGYAAARNGSAQRNPQRRQPGDPSLRREYPQGQDAGRNRAQGQGQAQTQQASSGRNAASRNGNNNSERRRGAASKNGSSKTVNSRPAKSRAALVVNILLIALSLAIVATIVLFYNSQNDDYNAASAEVLSYENVYDGVHVSGADVSGMSRDELVAFLNNEFGGDLDNKHITIKIGEVTEQYSFTDLGVRYNIEEAANQAFNIGRSGNQNERLNIIAEIAENPVNLHLVYTYDQEKVNELANRIAEDAGVLTEDAEVVYSLTSVIIKPGREGIRIDKDDLTKKLKEALDNFESAEIEVNLIMSQPNKIDAEKIFNTIYEEPADAYYAVSEDRKSISVVSDVPGKSVDRERLTKAIESLNSNSSAEVSIPLIPIEAAVKKADLGGEMFTDKLGSASTNFSVGTTNGKNRRENMTLATQKITGYILAPGDEFVFNEAVGKRTEADGYKSAGAFMNGLLIDDVGGGICQVSSTLYNAVLYADLTVTQRQNHSYIVGYVQDGFDATVSYPLPDFKFKNSSDHPVRIECGVEGTTISFSLFGTQVGPVKKITFTHEVKSTTAFNRVTTEDPNLPTGTTNVSQAGRTGYTIDTYKTVQIGDGPKETVKIATNKYKAMEQIETIGTGPALPGTDPEESIVIEPEEGEGDYISDAGVVQTVDPTEQGAANAGDGDTTEQGVSGDGDIPPEPSSTRPIRTPRNRETTTTDPDGQTASTGASDETTARQGDEGTTAAQTTAESAATQAATTEAAVTEAPTAAQIIETATSPADSGGAGSGGEEASAPKRTPRPRQ